MILNKLFNTEPQDRFLTPVNTCFYDDTFLLNAYDPLKRGLNVALGYDDFDNPVILDIETAPHVLIGGATRSGKSVCINLILCELLSRYTPNNLHLYIADPKKVDYMKYRDIPHLKDYQTEPETITAMLYKVENIMNNRYDVMQQQNVNHNQKLTEPFPYLIVVFDELASIRTPKAIKSLNNIARLGRACNIHLIIATQRPDRTVIDGQLKANCPTRISFRVQSATDSRVLLDRKGGETLKGNGDGVLFNSFGDFLHFQGHFISDNEISQITDFWKEQPLTASQVQQKLQALEPINRHQKELLAKAIQEQ